MNTITVNNWTEIPKNYTGHVKFTNSDQYWYKNGQLHREDGPAAIWDDGTQEWLKDRQLHREDGPAVIYPDGTQAWYKNGKRHREDGPAVIWANGEQQWWLNGKSYSKENYYRKLYTLGKITEQELFVELL